ncbi:MAG: MBOAT family protein [Firmicutes bacterium]|nr:MBOAT family protein [Bacillota bacterium]
MVFSSLTFLYVFLPVVLLVYWLAPKGLKNMILLIASLLFYAWGEPVYITIMLFSSLVDYSHGLLIEKYRQHPWLPKLILLSSVCINLSILFFFKYTDFVLHNLNAWLGTNLALLDLPLPIGISFFTFQTMSYTIDVYRDAVPVQRNLINFATYVTLFPQLIAGPIVRYSEVAREIDERTISWPGFYAGIWRLLIGLGKKVLLANNIGLLWEEISRQTSLSLASAWLGAAAFGLQIYFDFSGYSDMAIGLGRMLGFNFPENFNYPYISQSITEFWRRWHITLGSWFRDYVYFPLGGSRVSGFRYWRNLFLVWFLTGFWHGAAWNFILWGLYMGLLIAVERLFLAKLLRRVSRPLRHLYVLLALMPSWALFAIEDLTQLRAYLGIMLGLGGARLVDPVFVYYLGNNALLGAILLLAATPFFAQLARRVKPKSRLRWLQPIVLVIILFLTTAYLVADTYNPFLYFRF